MKCQARFIICIVYIIIDWFADLYYKLSMPFKEHCFILWCQISFVNLFCFWHNSLVIWALCTYKPPPPFSTSQFPFLFQERHGTPSGEEMGTAVLYSANASLSLFRAVILWANHAPNLKTLLISMLIFKKKAVHT